MNYEFADGWDSTATAEYDEIWCDRLVPAA